MLSPVNDLMCLEFPRHFILLRPQLLTLSVALGHDRIVAFKVRAVWMITAWFKVAADAARWEIPVIHAATSAFWRFLPLSLRTRRRAPRMDRMASLLETVN